MLQIVMLKKIYQFNTVIGVNSNVITRLIVTDVYPLPSGLLHNRCWRNLCYFPIGMCVLLMRFCIFSIVKPTDVGKFSPEIMLHHPKSQFGSRSVCSCDFSLASSRPLPLSALLGMMCICSCKYTQKSLSANVKVAISNHQVDCSVKWLCV